MHHFVQCLVVDLEFGREEDQRKVGVGKPTRYTVPAQLAIFGHARDTADTAHAWTAGTRPHLEVHPALLEAHQCLRGRAWNNF